MRIGQIESEDDSPVDKEREDIIGAVGLPVAAVAIALAGIAPFSFYIAWVPASLAAIVGAWGLWSAIKVKASRVLSTATLVIALASFVIMGAWWSLGWLISNVFAECFRNCS